MSLHNYNFLITESHLSPGVSRHVHPAEKYPIIWFCCRDLLGVDLVLPPQQLRLHRAVVLLVYDIIDAVTMDQQVFLWRKTVDEKWAK